MKKFWQDLKRTLKLYMIVIGVSMVIAMILIPFLDQDTLNRVAIGCGIVGGLWVVYKEHKWEKQCSETKDQENHTPMDSTSSGS